MERMTVLANEPGDFVKWASWAAYHLVTKRNEVEKWLREKGQLDAFSSDMSSWKQDYVASGEWDEEKTKLASQKLYQICYRQGLCEVMETRFQPPKDMFAPPRAVRTRGAIVRKPSAKRFQVLETAVERLQKLGQSLA